MHTHAFPYRQISADNLVQTSKVTQALTQRDVPAVLTHERSRSETAPIVGRVPTPMVSVCCVCACPYRRAVKGYMAAHNVKRAVVVGAGYIGMEVGALADTHRQHELAYGMTLTYPQRATETSQ